MGGESETYGQCFLATKNYLPAHPTNRRFIPNYAIPGPFKKRRKKEKRTSRIWGSREGLTTIPGRSRKKKEQERVCKYSGRKEHSNSGGRAKLESDRH